MMDSETRSRLWYTSLSGRDKGAARAPKGAVAAAENGEQAKARTRQREDPTR